MRALPPVHVEFAGLSITSKEWKHTHANHVDWSLIGTYLGRETYLSKMQPYAWGNLDFTRFKIAVECNWLCGQKRIEPDIITDNIIFEIKSMRYFDGKGRRGGQGTAPEKIDSVFRKYSGCKKLVLVVLCGDMQNDRNGKIFLEAFQTQNFNDNKAVKVLYETFKESIIIISYKNIEKYLL